MMEEQVKEIKMDTKEKIQAATMVLQKDVDESRQKISDFVIEKCQAQINESIEKLTKAKEEVLTNF